ncbi:MAG TPA: hypothetical protein VJ801_20660, partial [Polyangia bacterium]|nr:hypothetical protein [Polyangia bacterium]
MKSKGLDPAACLMGGFMEDEEHGEYGLIVTPDRQLIWYERNTLSNKLHKWEHHSDAAALTSMFAEAEVAYDMMRAASPASAGGSSSPTTKGRSKAPRAPNGLPPVVKSRICVASLRCSSVKYVEYSPSSRLGPLATAQFHSV